MPDGSIVLVELFGQRLTRVAPDGTVSTVAEVEGGPNGAAVGPDGAIYLCNNGGCFTPVEFGGMTFPGPFDPSIYLGGRIQRIDPHDGSVTDLYTECDGRPLRAPNDLVMDGHGGFYFTDHGIRDHEARTSDLTAIYYARADGSAIHEVAFPVEGPNGIGLSPDSDTLYWAETATGRIFRRAVVGQGELAEPIPLTCPRCCTACPASSTSTRWRSMARDGCAWRRCSTAASPPCRPTGAGSSTTRPAT